MNLFSFWAVRLPLTPLAPVMGFAETGLPCVPNSACRALSSSSASPRPLAQTQPVRLSKNKPAPERKTASEGISSDAVFHKRQSKGCLVIASTTEPQACELPLPYRFLQHCRSKHRHSKLPDSCSIRFHLLQPPTLPHDRSYRAAPPSNQPLH